MRGFAIGFFGGFVCWYLAHEIGVYYSDANCRHPWVLPLVHGLLLAASLTVVWLAYRELKKGREAIIGVGLASLFSLVIFWQGLATLIFTRCEK